VGNNPEPPVAGGAQWPGRDLARGLAVRSDGSAGYVLDTTGALHRLAVGISGNRPLRVAVIGDSLTNQSVQAIEDTFAATGRARVVAIHGISGSGIVNDYDWTGEIDRDVDQEDPDVIVAEFVGNYFPPWVTRPDGRAILPDTSDFFELWAGR